MDLNQYSDISAALSNENRLKIVAQIAQNGEQCAQRLLEVFNISQPTMSQHIKVLRHANILLSRKEGRWQFFTLNVELMEEYNSFAAQQLIRPATRFKAHPAYENRARFGNTTK
ncbi:ArsR/SmtB family transcription factor [Psittacicella hinzii]|nr:metalloregulator ArsR/SmtB family transcription factor [Psittacicella hinzii]